MSRRMPWYRVYDGMPYHPLWRLVARQTARPITEVLSVALCLLDHASKAEPRGAVSDVDVESIGITIGVDDAVVASVVSALVARGWIIDGELDSWSERQPAREDSTATERKREQRKRDKDLSRNVTPGHAQSRQRPENVTPREEESRFRKIPATAANVIGLDSIPRTCARAAE